MKQITIILSAVLVLVSSYTFAGGKKDGGFNGSIKYKVSTEGREVTPQEQSGMPTEIAEYYLGNMVRKDVVTPMYSMIVIVNTDTKETIMLMDLPMMGKKMYIKKTGEEVKAAEAKVKDSLDLKPEVKLLDATKTIAGYTCKKAELTQGENVATVFYTEDIKANNEDFEGVPGFPLYYTTNLPQDEELILIYQATEISKKKPKKKMFAIPSDYEEMSPEMQKQMGM
jgi:GLPGLI family protein